MAFGDWISWAISNQGDKLIFFNFKNEIRFHRDQTGVRGKFFEPTNLPAHIAEFVDYLDATAAPPEKALRTFSGGICSPGNQAGKPLAKPRTLAGIKGYGGFRRPGADPELATFGLSSIKCNDAELRVAAIINDTLTDRPNARNLNAREKRAVAQIVADHFVPSPRHSWPGRSSSATSSPSIATVVPARPAKPELMWLTDRDELDKACAAPASTVDAVLNSAHITQVRRELGLASPHDRQREFTGGAARAADRMNYRIFLSFESVFPDADLPKIRQPNIFSQGFDYLFVSRRPTNDPAVDDDMSGRTVRLIDSKCDHDGLGLEGCPRCGAVGLPEAVVPREDLFSHSNVTLRGAHVAFSSDLTRYQIPEAELIRTKNKP